MGAGMGIGELFLILMIFAAVFGSTRMQGPSDLFNRLMRGEDPARPSVPERASSRWTTVDWLLLLTTLAIALTLTMAVTRRR